ncbi:unnamed protein product [Linum perenne]
MAAVALFCLSAPPLLSSRAAAVAGPSLRRRRRRSLLLAMIPPPPAGIPSTPSSVMICPPTPPRSAKKNRHISFFCFNVNMQQITLLFFADQNPFFFCANLGYYFNGAPQERAEEEESEMVITRSNRTRDQTNTGLSHGGES